MPTTETHTVPYAHQPEPGGGSKLLDVYRPADDLPSAACVLLWHGVGPDERDVLAPLAREVAHNGVVVFVPDWRADSADLGRSHLLDSLRFVRDHASEFGGDPARITVAGWSASAAAAIGIALHPELVDGWRPTAVVGIAGRYDWPARTTGTIPGEDLADVHPAPVPVWLIHGAKDTRVDGQHSRSFHAGLRAHGWPAHLEEPDADHVGVVMTEYDPELQRCRPTDVEHILQAGRLTARSVVRAASGAPPHQ
ncbi:carboxylesterase family protein [Streptomyces sp. NBC_01142]|uniref:alpha/beta hydrolase n=1 Tax=Streptomyces sp. NBC_01142 TaxID=2975865 RepID=UPI002259CFE3|nr:carboxylesterase family protein [Streptomyces sp. NBC_01142]MCX4825545.1 carboxylesterase family protein [Streptomyces sp. NBC_01142]